LDPLEITLADALVLKALFLYSGDVSGVDHGVTKASQTTGTQDDRDGEEHQTSLRPFFGFYGGKWRDALKNYPQPKYDTVIEPFAGSAGYSVRYYQRNVVLCEADPIIAAVWDYLIHVTPGEILAIPDLKANETVDNLRVCREARWLVGLWLNRGASRPRKGPSKWMRDRVRPGSFWGERVRNTIASQVPLIRHWKIHICSYASCPVGGEATWFVDPPYQETGNFYHFGSKSIDYSRLSNWCRELSGQVIVCERAGADWLPFRSLPPTKTTRNGRRSPEVLWIG
jgi:hypothetical protein